MFALQTIISSPLKLMVNSSLTMEEMCVITIDFLAKLDMATQENLTVNIEVRVMKSLQWMTLCDCRFKRATLLL